MTITKFFDANGNQIEYMLLQPEADFLANLQYQLSINGHGGDLSITVLHDNTLSVAVDGLGNIGRIRLRGQLAIEILRPNPKSSLPYSAKHDLKKASDANGFINFWVDYANKLRDQGSTKQAPVTVTPPPTNNTYTPSPQNQKPSPDNDKKAILLLIFFAQIVMNFIGIAKEPIYGLIILPVTTLLIVVLFLCGVRNRDLKRIESTLETQRREHDAHMANIKAERNRISAEKEALQKLKAELTEDHYLELKAKIEKSNAEFKKNEAKVGKFAFLFSSIKQYIDSFPASEQTMAEQAKITALLNEMGLDYIAAPTVEGHLHCVEMRDLRKQMHQIDKDIDATLKAHEGRYTTKANLAIYRLMVIALRAELQNVLNVMKFDKLSAAEERIDEICSKYAAIAADGNASIAPTITRFVWQIRALFIDAVRVEYEYYVRKEKAKEEQRAIRDRMRQEAEERKKLEAEQKKIEAEEKKFADEMEKLRRQMANADTEKTDQLLARIRELEEKMSQVEKKKDSIAKLQNGKAGYVYVISNLGSFGDHVFKVGMTRRMVPQERVDELGDASVPFAFDVHSMIFSEDAAALETAIHHQLNNKRVNKINLRKEFFDVSVDELEALVHSIQPTAEFTKTMLAEQYRQSLSMETIFDLPAADLIDNGEDAGSEDDE